MNESETPDGQTCPEYPFQEMIAAVVRIASVAVGQGYDAVSKDPDLLFGGYEETKFISKKITDPVVVITREENDLFAGVSEAAQRSQKIEMAPGNNMRVFEPEIKNITEENDVRCILGFLR